MKERIDDFKAFWDASMSNITEDDLFECYIATLVFKNWKFSFHALDLKEFDTIFNELHEDVNASFFQALFGLYRSAHMQMRSTIELTLQLIYFFHHPIEYKKWQQGDFVIRQEELMTYLKTYPNFEMEVSDLLDFINKNWKHFSKYIHGESPPFFYCETEARQTNDFTRQDFGQWKSNLTKNIYTLNKLLLFFFKTYLNNFPNYCRELLTSLLNEDDLKELEIDA